MLTGTSEHLFLSWTPAASHSLGHLNISLESEFVASCRIDNNKLLKKHFIRCFLCALVLSKFLLNSQGMGSSKLRVSTVFFLCPHGLGWISHQGQFEPKAQLLLMSVKQDTSCWTLLWLFLLSFLREASVTACTKVTTFCALDILIPELDWTWRKPSHFMFFPNCDPLGHE